MKNIFSFCFFLSIPFVTASQAYISGPDESCNGNIATFRIEGLPSNATSVGWTFPSIVSSDVKLPYSGIENAQVMVQWGGTGDNVIIRASYRVKEPGESGLGELRPVTSKTVKVLANGGAIGAGVITPSNSFTCYNTSPGTIVSTTSASGSGFSRYFWWKKGASDQVYRLLDVNNSSLEPGSLTEATYFYREAKFKCSSVTTEPVLINVRPPLHPGSITGPTIVCFDSGPFNINNVSDASGGSGTYLYEWEVSSDNINFQKVEQAITNTNYLYFNQRMTSKKYIRRKVTSCGVSYSNTWTVDVLPELQPGAISPNATIVCAGTTVNFSSTPPSGGNGTYSYQWYRRTKDQFWDIVSGATGEHLSIALGNSSDFYRSVRSCGTEKRTQDAGVIVSPTSRGGVAQSSKEAFTSYSGYIELINESYTGTITGWQKREAGSTQWTPINILSTRLDITGVTKTTDFRAIVKSGVCPQDHSTAATISIYQCPTLSLSGPQRLVYGSGTTLQASSGYHSYKWYRNAEPLNWIGHVQSVSEPGVYKVEVKQTGSSPTCFSNEVMVNGISAQNDVNYISITSFRKPGITTTTNLYQLPVSDFTQTIDYQDGLGRSIQRVAVFGGTGSRDLIQPVQYDRHGRSPKRYLPYANDNNHGLYRADAIESHSLPYRNSGQAVFYNEAASTNKVASDAAPFSVTVYEQSPLGRVTKQGAVGVAWQPATTVNDPMDKSVKNVIEFNETNEVLLFTFISSTGTISVQNAGVVQYFPANVLFKNKVYDENGNLVITFEDKLGKTILKKVQNGSAPSGPVFASTYYVYDELGRLALVLPPEAINSMNNLFTQN